MPPGDFVYGRASTATRALDAPLLTVGCLLVAAGLIASAVSLVLRLRTGHGRRAPPAPVDRVVGRFLAFGVVVILVVPRLQGEEGTWLAGLPLRLAQLAVPLCVAVAVLRHRLLEIDLIVNRALVVALATGAGGRRLRARRRHRRPRRRWTAPAASGPRCSRPPWWRWPSSRCGAAWSGSPTGSPSAPPPPPTKRWPTSAAASATAPTPSALLPAVADAAAHAVNARRAAVLLHVDAGPDRIAAWPPHRA